MGLKRKSKVMSILLTLVMIFMVWPGVASAAAPDIISYSLDQDNVCIQVTVSEGVYTNSDGTGGVTPDDFILNFAQNGGAVSAVTTSGPRTLGNGDPEGGETSFFFYLALTGWPPSGTETIEIKPKDGDSVYNAAGEAMAAGATTGAIHLLAPADTTPPTYTLNPANGTGDVPVNATPTITYSEPVRNIDDSEITDLNVGSLVIFKETNALGADVAFTASIDATQTVITVTPSAPLKYSRAYYLELQAVEDASDNSTDVPWAIFFTEDDTTPPSWITDFPDTFNVQDTDLVLEVAADETCTVYYVIFADGTAPGPTSEQVESRFGDTVPGGNFYYGDPLYDPPNQGNHFVGGLTPDTAYDIYVVLEDGAGNLQAAPVRLDVTTLPEIDTDPADSTSGITGQVQGAAGSKQVTLTVTLQNAAGDAITGRTEGDFAVSVDDVAITFVDNPPFSCFTDNGDGTYTVVFTGAADNTAYTFTDLTVNGFLIEAGPTTVTTPPAALEPAGYHSKLSAGYYHTEVLSTDGALWGWGQNSVGQVGDGTTTTTNVPVPLNTGNEWVSVVCGDAHNLALKSDGTLWSWGYNNFGQLGIGPGSSEEHEPVQVGTDNDWVHITAGYECSAAIKSDGTLWTWGRNLEGQLGLGNTESRDTPTQVGGATDWESVSLGEDHALAIKNNGTLWSWGYNGWGQLGNGVPSDSVLAPAQIGEDNDWIYISAGNSYSLALKSNGTLWAWGSNEYGILGTPYGDLSYSSSPVQVNDDTDWALIAAGVDHVLAIKQTGTLWAWGNNYSGQLGTLPIEEARHTPTQIGADTDWCGIAAGSRDSFAIKTDGSLWAWGQNNIGQLGDGTTDNRITPVQVVFAGQADYVCAIGETQYATLDDALDAAGDCDTIKLLKDIPFDGGILIEGISIIFDLNGYTLDVVNAAGYGLRVEDGTVVLADSSFAGDGQFNVTGTTYGVIAWNGTATVTNATATGVSGIGAYAGSGGMVYVQSNAQGILYGVSAQGADSSVSVVGDAEATGAGSYGAYAGSGGSVEVFGNVQGGQYGVSADSPESSIFVGGNAAATESGEPSAGAHAGSGGSVVLAGNVQGGKYGAFAGGGGEITINGEMTAQYYIRLGGSIVLFDDFDAVSTKEGYRTYSRTINDVTSTIWVKITAPVDIAPPAVTNYSPADGATNVGVNTSLVLTFSENVTAVAGKNIYIKRSSDGATVAAIAADAGQVTVSGATVTINPSSNLNYSTGYYVNIDNGAFIDDAATPNAYAGISDATTWNFTTKSSGGGGGGGGGTTDPGELKFSDDGYAAGEGNGSIEVTVKRTSGTDGRVTVEYATSDGTARAGEDYTAVSGKLTFDDGDGAESFSIPLLDDSLVEDDETIKIKLKNVTGGATLETSTAEITIEDNDTATPAPAKKVVQLTLGQRAATVDGRPYTLDATPYVDAKANRTLVPLRFVSEALGAQVDWNAENRTITIRDGDNTIVLSLGSRTALVNGAPVTLDTTPAVVGNRTFVPLRFVSETLGATVDYDPATKQITVTR